MSIMDIKAVVAVDSTVDRAAVQAALPDDGGIKFVGALDVYEESWETLGDSPADVILVACTDGSEQIPAFIEAAVRDRPARPVIVMLPGTPNGYLRRVFDAGADDIVALDSPSAREEIRFAVEKAVARRRQGRSDATAQGSMVSVLGPKGGVGKTVTACNLAVALADLGHSVALVDLDLQFGDVGLAMGIRPSKTIFDLARSGGSLDEDKLEDFLAPHPSGVRVLIAPTRPDQKSAISIDFLRNVYGVLRATTDYVVIDTPTRFDAEVVDAIERSSSVCMVGTLDALALKTTRLGLETLDRMGTDPRRVWLVLNRSDSRVGISPADVAAIVSRPPDVMVPSHRDVAVSVNGGEPITAKHPRSDVAKAFKSLAQLLDTPEPGGPAAKSRLLRRRKARAV